MAPIDEQDNEEHEERKTSLGMANVNQVGHEKQGGDQGSNSDQHQECDVPFHIQEALDAQAVVARRQKLEV